MTKGEGDQKSRKIEVRNMWKPPLNDTIFFGLWKKKRDLMYVTVTQYKKKISVKIRKIFPISSAHSFSNIDNNN